MKSVCVHTFDTKYCSTVCIYVHNGCYIMGQFIVTTGQQNPFLVHTESSVRMIVVTKRHRRCLL